MLVDGVIEAREALESTTITDAQNAAETALATARDAAMDTISASKVDIL